jgi:hypothetical protein
MWKQGLRSVKQSLRHRLASVAAVIGVVAVAGATLAVSAGLGPDVHSTPTGSRLVAFDPTGGPTASRLIVSGTLTPDPTPTATPAPTITPIDVLLHPEHWVDQRRPSPVQSRAWLKDKAIGRVALVNGRTTILPASANVLVSPTSRLAVPDKALLDTSWTRWIIEVPGSGQDEKGNWFSNLSYWEFCGDGAMTVALWYWQQLTGAPDVTGTAGYFLDPYAAEGVAWPDPGPSIRFSGGEPVGTYWSGSDDVSGFTAHGRGFEMYLAMAAHPPTWQSTGYALFALDGKPLYPSFGTQPANTVAGLNWEASGHNPNNWGETYYAMVVPSDPTLAADLTAAVMLDVGRDGVPVVALADSFNLPNWQNGDSTPHIPHSIAIVGYDNTANPPTFTYTETCGRACNRRGGNTDGDIHVIPQSDMVLAIANTAGSGFVW